MAAASFERSLVLTLAYEGGTSDHPDDPGGLTQRGVTQGTYDAWRRRKKLTTRRVTAISDEEIRSVYREGYWNTVSADELPAGIDFAVFDYSVNSGPARSAKALQKLVGVGQDGVIGNLTLDAVERLVASIGEDLTVKLLCEERLAFVKRLKTWATFGRGWSRRVMGQHQGFQDGDRGVIDYATMMARADDSAPPPIQPAPGKAWPDDLDPRWLHDELAGMAAELNAIVGRLDAAA